MENLLNCNGRRFRAKIDGVECEGKIRVENGDVYLCQNDKDGCNCKYKFGYRYSWKVTQDGIVSFNAIGIKVSDFHLLCMTPSEIESYKDWQVGDKVSNGKYVYEVIFRCGELVVTKNEHGKAMDNATCNELYNYGLRLVADPAPEDDTVEMTMDEIAAKVGVPVEKLRIKKEEE